MKTVACHSLTLSVSFLLLLWVEHKAAPGQWHLPTFTSSTTFPASAAQILALSVNNCPPHNLRLMLVVVIFLQRYLEWKISDWKGTKTFLSRLSHLQTLHAVFQATRVLYSSFIQDKLTRGRLIVGWYPNTEWIRVKTIGLGPNVQNGLKRRIDLAISVLQRDTLKQQ